MKYTGAAVRVRKVPSLPSLVKLKVKTLIIGAYRASAKETITMKSIKFHRAIPKNIGIGPKEAIRQPRTMSLNGGWVAYIGVKKNKNTIISRGATDTYTPNGAFSPSSCVIILGIIKNRRLNTILLPTMTKLKSINLQNLSSLTISEKICPQVSLSISS